MIKRSTALSWVVTCITIIVLVVRMCWRVYTGQSSISPTEIGAIFFLVSLAAIVAMLLGHSVRRLMLCREGGAAPLEALTFVPVAVVLGGILWCI